MSVLVKGMKMPKTCWECFAENSLNVYVVVFGGHCPFGERIVHIKEFDARTGRHPCCPLVDVPTPHGRLIDADAILSQYNGNILTAQNDYAEGLRDAAEDIKTAPTIIEAEGEV